MKCGRVTLTSLLNLCDRFSLTLSQSIGEIGLTLAENVKGPERSTPILTLRVPLATAPGGNLNLMPWFLDLYVVPSLLHCSTCGDSMNTKSETLDSTKVQD